MRRKRNNLVLIVAVGSLAGLLLWGKLRLVGNVPRSVYADPKARAASGPSVHASPGNPAPAR